MTKADILRIARQVDAATYDTAFLVGVQFTLKPVQQQPVDYPEKATPRKRNR